MFAFDFLSRIYSIQFYNVLFPIPFLVLFGTLYFVVRTNDKTGFSVCLMRRPILGALNIYSRRQLRKERVAFTDLLRNKPTITKKILTGKWMHEFMMREKNCLSHDKNESRFHTDFHGKRERDLMNTI